MQNRWLRVKDQIKFLHDVWPELPSQLQIHFNSILAIINAKLIEASTLLDTAIGSPIQHQDINTVVQKKGKPHRGAFAFNLKESLDNIIRELDTWQHYILDPPWYQLIRVSNERLDQIVYQHARQAGGAVRELESLRELIHTDHTSNSNGSVFLENKAIDVNGSQIEFTESRLGCDRQSGTSVVLDPVRLPVELGSNQAMIEVRSLARKFGSNDIDTFGLLKCQGVLRSSAEFSLVFRFPDGLNHPVSLRRILLEANADCPLNARLSIGQKLARSIMFMHSFNFVHKSVRPENILCFSSQGKFPERPYLVGFERFRLIDVHSIRSSDSLWERDIYRHPGRQGIRPEQTYTFQHDIYSLGVCLLEIGIWRSFLNWPEGGTSPIPNEAFVSSDDLKIKDPRKRAVDIKAKFTRLAHERLPGLMGNRYTSIVMSCLTCLDENNADFGDQREFLDEDGILAGVRYIEKV